MTPSRSCTMDACARRLTFVLALAALLARPAGAIVAAGQSATTFHAEARLVVVHATVRGAHGELVTGLERPAFTVYENGKPQPIALFLRDDTPISAGIVVDNSGSMRGRRGQVEAAALAFVRASNPLDELFVVNFGDTPHLDVAFTSDAKVLEAGLGRLDSIGGTALRDAVDMAMAYLDAHAVRDRKALLVITDGNDNASLVSADRIRTRAEQTGIAIYAIGLPQADAGKARRAQHELDDLTDRTGGLACHLARLDDIESTTLDLARQIRHQYTMAYTPLNQALDGSYRKIRVVAHAKGRVSVRAREGYYATPRAAVATGAQ